MRSLKKIIIGSGMSSFIYFLSNDKKIDVCSSNDNKIHNRSNFYELNAIGGNTNIWGGYINLKRHEFFKVIHTNHSIALLKLSFFQIKRYFKGYVLHYIYFVSQPYQSIQQLNTNLILCSDSTAISSFSSNGQKRFFPVQFAKKVQNL